MSSALTLIPDDDMNLLAQAVGEIGGSDTNAIYLRHDGNTGDYSYGADQTVLPDGTEAILVVSSLKRGYICWVDQKVVAEVLVGYRDGAPPPRHTLTDHGPYAQGDGWSDQTVIDLQILNADLGNPMVTFKASTQTKIRAVGAALTTIMQQSKTYPGHAPVIELGNNSFTPKDKAARGAVKYAPTFKVVEWLSGEAVQTLIESTEQSAPVEDEPQEELVERTTAGGRAGGRAAIAAPVEAAAATGCGAMPVKSGTSVFTARS